MRARLAHGPSRPLAIMHFTIPRTKRGQTLDDGFGMIERPEKGFVQKSYSYAVEINQSHREK